MTPGATEADAPTLAPATHQPLVQREAWAEFGWPPEAWATDEPSDCLERLSGTERTQPGRAVVTIYFSCTPEEGPFVPAAAARQIEVDEDPLSEAIDALLSGPTAREREAGFFSDTFGDETSDLPFDAWAEDSMVIVDLDPAILEVESAFVSRQEVGQLSATAGQFSGVERVLILVGGEPWCRALASPEC